MRDALGGPRRGGRLTAAVIRSTRRARSPSSARDAPVPRAASAPARCSGRRPARSRSAARSGTPSGGAMSSGGMPSIVRSRSPRTSSMRGSESSRPQAYGIRGFSNSVVDRAGLDDPAGVHDVDPVAHPGGDPEVVGDHQDGGPELGRQPLDELEDLGLDRDVEGGRRLVGEDQLRVARQRDGDHHALAHAARELERVVVEPVLRAAGCRPWPAARRSARGPPCATGPCARGSPRRSGSRWSASG